MTSLLLSPGLRMALMRSTRAALTWINHLPRSRRIGYRAAPLGSVEAMASQASHLRLTPKKSARDGIFGHAGHS